MSTTTRPRGVPDRTEAERFWSKVDNRGVSIDRRSGKWRAFVVHHGKVIHVGLFTDVEQAAEAAAERRRELFNAQ